MALFINKDYVNLLNEDVNKVKLQYAPYIREKMFNLHTAFDNINVLLNKCNKNNVYRAHIILTLIVKQFKFYRCKCKTVSKYNISSFFQLSKRYIDN